MGIHSPQWHNLLNSTASLIDIDLDSQSIDQIANYVSELLGANTKVNLTSITNMEEVAEKHILDSLIPAKFLPVNASVLDLGTGGGFPGIPLKIFMPSLSVSLVDSSRKKINFLKYVTRVLNLKNISAHQYRVEELSSHPDFVGQFDVVISRAFTSLEKFLELSVPFIKPEGRIIAMKGKEVQKEIDALTSAEIGEDIYIISDNKFELHIEKYRLPVSGDERSLVIARNQFL
jgi:16S rRNA (guanine527-N7)-methyltransferase